VFHCPADSCLILDLTSKDGIMKFRSLAPVRRQRLHETIASHLEELILTGEFKPDEPLPTENEMAAQLQVSRTVVRDAIRVLATKGLVDIRHGVGTFVTKSGRERLAEALALSLRRGDYTPLELYSVRYGLELVVVDEAIRKVTPEQIREMREALARYHRQLKEPGAPRVPDEHMVFHQLMVRSTGNRVLIDLLDPITVFRIPEDAGMDSMWDKVPDYDTYLQGHAAIVDAIEARDLDAARTAMRDHLQVLKERAERATNELTGSLS
jgi:GntR family transcriptional regulator, transcriptional repressor for pyruvate dehydrogenase complex